jgi:hypothetical protein
MSGRRSHLSPTLALIAIGLGVLAASCSLINANAIGGPVSIDGPFAIAGPLTVGGPVVVHGPVRARKLVLGGPFYTIPGGETPGPAGQIATGPLFIGGPLTVNGPLTVDGTLTIGGLLTAESSGAYGDQPAAAESPQPTPGAYSQIPVTE